MNFFSKTKKLILSHKFISGIIIIILLIVGYYGYGVIFGAKATTSYVTSAAAKGTITTSVSGSGQVTASNQLSVKTEASGRIVYLNIQAGQEVKAGTLLAEIDPTDAQKTVQSAENDLANAKLSTTDVSSAATDALSSSYDGGLNALTNTFKDLATIKANLDPLFTASSYYGSNSDINYYLSFIKFYDNNPTSLNYWNNDAEKKYNDMQTTLAATEQAGWLINKSSSDSQIEGAINDTYTSSAVFLDLVRQAFNLTQEYQNTLSSKSLTTPIKSATTATQITNLSNAVSSLATDTSALLSAKNDIIAKKQAFSEIGTNIQSQNLNIQQYQNALADAKNALAKYYMYAPIDGTIATADSTILTGDTISSGTTIGSIVSNQEIITATFNEVDVVKIQLGQKVIITFDALPNFTITGKVASIDTVSTTSQGVVSYGVKISLDVADSQIKPGMSATLIIITNVKQDALLVPNAAVKTQGTIKYVQVLVNNIPQQKIITTGLTNDTNTEIVSGLNEGDKVITQTVTTGSASSTATRTTSSGSTLRIPGITGGAGGFRGN